MSRVAKMPVSIPKGVEVKINNQVISIKGPKGARELPINDEVKVDIENDILTFIALNDSKSAKANSGTSRALINNLVIGVSEGHERKLTLVGVGYNAQAQGNKLNLNLGYSHPVNVDAPQGITFETPSKTEIVVKGIDKSIVGKIAAEIRSVRPPEPYKGKGIRYSDEHILRKEAKKK